MNQKIHQSDGPNTSEASIRPSVCCVWQNSKQTLGLMEDLDKQLEPVDVDGAQMIVSLFTPCQWIQQYVGGASWFNPVLTGLSDRKTHSLL